MSKILFWKAVVSLRLTLEFIFICQNASVNVQKEPLSLGAKEANPLMFFFFLPYFFFWLEVSNFAMIMHSHFSIQIHYCPPLPAKPHLFSLCAHNL